MDYNELTVKELRELCRENDLLVSGKRAELVARLEVAELPVAEEVIEEKAEETPKTEVDLMESEIPNTFEPLDDARSHFKGPGSVSGEWIFDNVPGSIAAKTLEEALEKHRTMPGNLKVPGSH